MTTRKMEIIRRNIELRASEEENSRKVYGQAVVYDSWSRDLGGFTEIIRSGAISQDLVDNSDVICNINHDNNQMVARWKRGNGTLRLILKDDGLYFEFEAPETERGNELLWNLRHGNLEECSFAFSLPNNKTCQKWIPADDGSLKREIYEIGGLYDVSIVTLAAYPATSVDNRAEVIDIEMIKRSLEEAENEAKAAEEEAKRAEEAKKAEEIVATLDIRLKDFLNSVNV